MPQIVEVPGQGNVEFPDGMSNQDIGRVVRLHQPEPDAKGSPEWAAWRNQRQHDLNDTATVSQTPPTDTGYLHMLWNKISPFALNPVTFPAQAGHAARAQADQAVASAKSGDYLSSGGHALAAAVPVLGPGAVHFGENAGTAVGAYLGGNPDPEATKEAVTDAAALALPIGVAKGTGPALRGAVSTLDRFAPGVRPMVADALRSNAETQYGRVLDPKTNVNKATTAEIVPQLIDRGVVAPTLKGLQSQAQAHIARVGEAIGNEWDNLPPDATAPLKVISDRLDAEIGQHQILDAQGNPKPMGPVADQAIENIQSLKQLLRDVSAKDPQTGELVIPADKLRQLRQYFDKVTKQAGGFDGTNLKQQSIAAAHEAAADAIRAELGKQFPDIAKLNQEYSFWKNVEKVTSDTILRRQGQAVPMTARMAQAVGFAKAGVLGAEAMKRLTMAMRSPAWGTVSAVLKDRLADAIAQGNAPGVTFYANKIAQQPAAPPALPGAAPAAIAPPAAPAAALPSFFAGTGKAMSANLYEMLFKKLQAGDLTELGQPSRVLHSAAAAFARGEIKSPEDLANFVQSGPAPAAAAALPPELDLFGNPVEREAAAEPAAAAPAAAAAAAPDAPGAIRKMDPRQIEADPARFQFKRDTGGASGTGDELKGVQKFDPELGGVLSVWRDPADGKTYVVNGHHRLELAQRAGAPDVTVRYLDAESAGAARTKGALINIAEGRGSAIDAAKVFRDTGMDANDLAAKGISLKGAIAKDGNNLARLAPQIFSRVIQGELPVERAALIGELLPEHADQQAALELLDRAEAKDKGLSNDAFRELVGFVKGAPKKAGDAGSNMNLFGDVEPAEESTALEMATLSDYIRKRLTGERNLFNVVSNTAKSKTLEQAGNALIGEKNAQIAEAANQHLAVYDKLKTSAGAINDALRAAAQSLGRKGAPASEIKQHAYARVRAAIRQTLGERPAQPAN